MKYFITVFEGNHVAAYGGPYNDYIDAKVTLDNVMLRDTEHAKMENEEGKVIGWWSRDGVYNEH